MMTWYRRLLTTIRVRSLESDLDREFAFHIAEKTDQFIASGLNEEEARRRARRQFGNLTSQKENSRDAYVITWLESIARNTRIGIRSLVWAPMLSAGVILTLALGIGANSAVFSVVDAVLIRPLGFPDGDRLMLISQENPKSPSPFAAPDRVEDWNRMNSTFQNITGYYTEDVTETSGDVPEKLTRAFVAPRFLDVWGIAPSLGRGFTSAEQRVGGPGAVLISDRLWRRRFNADPNAIGRRLHFGSVSAAVVGVMPASFRFPDLDVDIRPRRNFESPGSGRIALAVILLSGAGLLVRSIRELGRVEPGFDPDHVLTFRVSGSYAETNNYPALTNRILRTLDLLRAIPGVEASATAMSLPGVPAPVMQSQLTFMDGPADPDTKIIADSRVASDGYFAAMRIPLLAGESCPQESPASTPLAGTARHANALVNHRFADTYFAGSSPIGRYIQGLANFPPAEIRGIVGNARERGLQNDPGPTVYWCTSASDPSPFFLVRTKGDPSAIIPAVRRKLRDMDPQRSVFDFAPLTERLDEAFSQNRLRTILLVLFGFAAVLLAAAGLFSSLSYLVSVRRREIAVRMALGASSESVVGQILIEGIRLTLIASTAGLAVALGLTRLLTGFLYGVSPSDPLTLSAVVILVVTLGVIASLFPAFRAARFEPMAILREE